MNQRENPAFQRGGTAAEPTESAISAPAPTLASFDRGAHSAGQPLAAPASDTAADALEKLFAPQEDATAAIAETSRRAARVSVPTSVPVPPQPAALAQGPAEFVTHGHRARNTHVILLWALGSFFTLLGLSSLIAAIWLNNFLLNNGLGDFNGELTQFLFAITNQLSMFAPTLFWVGLATLIALVFRLALRRDRRLDAQASASLGPAPSTTSEVLPS